MNSLAFLLAAALTPRERWHERWKYVNRLAGAISAWAEDAPDRCLNDSGIHAQEILKDLAQEFAQFLDAQEEAGEDVRAIRAQESELITGLAKRVAECLMLGRLSTIAEVKATLDAIRRTKERG